MVAQGTCHRALPHTMSGFLSLYSGPNQLGQIPALPSGQTSSSRSLTADATSWAQAAMAGFSRTWKPFQPFQRHSFCSLTSKVCLGRQLLGRGRTEEDVDLRGKGVSHASPAVAYLMPGVLSNSSLLREDLNKPLGLTLIEHHASNCGDQRRIGQEERAVAVLGSWRGKKEQGLTFHPKTRDIQQYPSKGSPGRSQELFHSFRTAGWYSGLLSKWWVHIIA